MIYDSAFLFPSMFLAGQVPPTDVPLSLGAEVFLFLFFLTFKVFCYASTVA